MGLTLIKHPDQAAAGDIARNVENSERRQERRKTVRQSVRQSEGVSRGLTPTGGDEQGRRRTARLNYSKQWTCLREMNGDVEYVGARLIGLQSAHTHKAHQSIMLYH